MKHIHLTGKKLHGILLKININMHNFTRSDTNTLTYIQYTTLVIAIVGAFYVDFSMQMALLSVAFFYVFSILGLSLTLHRYYSHKNFEFRYELLRKFFTIIAILSGRGSPLGWVYIHRLHHKHADTDSDPHGPTTTGFKMFGFKPVDESKEKMKMFLIKDFINKEHLAYHNNYLLFIIGYACLLWIISFDLLYFAYVLPLLSIQFSQNCFNFFAHKTGYRNHNTKDDSTNTIWLWPLIWGDAWHNNHHNNLAKFTTKEKWWEFDPVVKIAGVVRK